jgi:hypothetical protein
VQTTTIPVATTSVPEEYDDEYQTSTTSTIQVPAPETTTTTTADDRRCAFEIIFTDSIPDAGRALSRFRDRRLACSDAGVKLITLYYTHSGEIAEVLIRQPELRIQAAALLREMLPVLSARHDWIRISTIQTRRIVQFLNLLKAHASVELQKDIAWLCTGIKSGALLSEIGISVK